ncbi:MAG: hypothetical protein R2861_03805 [Desulfobacterales bacterium]
MFHNDAVMSGEKRALYLWRRVYGETMAPSQGFPIETAAQTPRRYADFLAQLKLPEQAMFWEAIWKLADDPDFEAARHWGRFTAMWCTKSCGRG